jgi:AraC-like DNA-binding protein
MTIKARIAEEGTLAPQHVARALAVLDREVADRGQQPVQITLPTTCSVQPVLEALLANPARDRTLQAWAKQLDMSPSTFQRAFHRDTNTSFGAWRTRVRLLVGLRRLAEGADVASVANELGYGVSAFVQTFRKTLGTTPGKYFARHGAERRRAPPIPTLRTRGDERC